jgi:tripeptide aminopeptidase
MEAARKSSTKADPRLIKEVSELVSSAGVKRCLKFLHSQRHWINEKHIELCRVAAPTFFEEKRAEWMAAQFRSLGWEAKLDRAGNVLAYMNAERDGPFVALTAHLDTVLAPRTPEDIRLGASGRFHGAGVSDNGAGLAALLAFAAALKQSPPLEKQNAGVLLVANVGEEGEGNLSGMRFLCKQSNIAPKIRTYLVLDGPGTDHITCRALASRRFEVVVSGPGGHSWSDHGNANPVHALSRAIYQFTEAQFVGDFPVSQRSSFNFGTIEGGVSVNSIPSSARSKLDLRSEDPVSLDELSETLTYSVERALEMENIRSTGGRVQGKIREIGARPGGALSEDSVLLPSLRAVDAFLGIRAHLDCASTDANIPLSMGLDAVSIGAGGQGAGAHTPDEWYDPDGRELGLQRILYTLCRLLKA